VARAARSSPAPGAPLRLRGELGRTVTTLESEVERALGHAVLGPEDIHDLHRELRRLASGLTVWARLVALREEPEVRDVAARVRRLARLVGRVRDRDVTTTLLAPRSRTARASSEPVAWREFLGRLRDDTHTGRELLRAFLRSERQGGLFDRVRALLVLTPRPDANADLHRILAEERRLRQGRVRKAHRKARRRPSSERLHRLRIRIRQWRHLSTLEGVTRATSSHPPPPSWRRLQERLGRLHDLDVALATVPVDLARLSPALRLKRVRKELRRSVQASLERIAARPKQAAARARRRGGM
jgi:CHAD domain-containing protein